MVVRRDLVIVSIFILYTLGLFLLLLIHFTGNGSPIEIATLGMGLGLFMAWVIVGGLVQYSYRSNLREFFQTRKRPLVAFFFGAAILALTEEAIATLMTNASPFFGDPSTTAHITASTNYFDVISFHSLIVFLPMLFTLGLLLKKYTLSPFAAALLWGVSGLIGEFTLAGPQVFINTPFWLLVYGLMVYIPAHSFVGTQRSPISWIYTPFFILLITLSALATFWIPFALGHPSNHFTHQEVSGK